MNECMSDTFTYRQTHIHTLNRIVSYRICKTNGERARVPLKKVQFNGSHHLRHHFQWHFLELSIQHFLFFISSHSLAVTILWNCNVNHLSPYILDMCESHTLRRIYLHACIHRPKPSQVTHTLTVNRIEHRVVPRENDDLFLRCRTLGFVD